MYFPPDPDPDPQRFNDPGLGTVQLASRPRLETLPQAVNIVYNIGDFSVLRYASTADERRWNCGG